MAGSAESSDGFGSALAAGDLDGDGYADLAVGVPGEDVGSVEDAGAVVVLYGTVDGLLGAGSQLFTQDSGGVPGGVEAGDLFGSALAVGDFDRDSDADLAVGVAGEDVDGTADAGAVNVLYGKGAGWTGSAPTSSPRAPTRWVASPSRPTASAPRWPPATSTSTRRPTWRSGCRWRM